MAIEIHQLKVTTSGSAGSASGSALKTVPKGRVLGIYLNYHGSAPNTTDVTVKADADSTGVPPDLTILTKSNSNTDAWVYPKTQDHDNVGAAITGSYSDPVVHGGVISVAVAQSDALTDAVVIYVVLER